MRVIASQKLARDNGESIFAARHQDALQGPLGRVSFTEIGHNVGKNKWAVAKGSSIAQCGENRRATAPVILA